jgi:lipopolysaccharide export system permease protein
MLHAASTTIRLHRHAYACITGHGNVYYHSQPTDNKTLRVPVMRIFHRSVISEHIAPFFFAFAVIMFVLILKLMLTLIELLISRSVDPMIMAQLFVYNLAWMVALVVPMSVLVASVMAFGRMGASGEIIAMKAAGISMYRLVSPVILGAVALTIGMIWFNNVVLPEANHRASSLRTAILRSKPMVTLKNREGQFVTADDIPFTIRVDSIDYETDEIIGVNLFTKSQQGKDSGTIIVAQSGRFITASDRLDLVLSNGEVHRRSPDNPGTYVRSAFDTFTYVVSGLNFGIDTSRQSSYTDRSMTSAAMRTKISELEKFISVQEEHLAKMEADGSAPAEQLEMIRRTVYDWRKLISKYLVEIHKKNSIPIAAIIFVMIGSSLGILIRRSGASIGIGLSIGFFILYYLFLIGGENVADRLIVAPWLAMWAPNIVLGIMGIALFRYAVRR